MKYVVTNFMIIIAVMRSFIFASFSILPDDLTKYIRRERLAKIIPALYTVAFRRKTQTKTVMFLQIL